MGKAGHNSQKGIGEIDPAPRKHQILCYFTDDDYLLLKRVSKLLGKSQNQVILESFRNYAQYHAKSLPKSTDNTDS